jgi:hypothetical protein
MLGFLPNMDAPFLIPDPRSLTPVFHTSVWDVSRPGRVVRFPHPGLITSHFLFSRLQKPIREDFFRELKRAEGCEPTPRCYIEFSGFPAPTVL